MTNEDIYEAGADRIVAIFQDDEDQRTTGVGFLDDEGERLLFSVSNPTEIMMMAHRLAMLAEEIQENQNHSINKVIDMFQGYPEGTTLREIMSGKAQKIIRPVETD